MSRARDLASLMSQGNLLQDGVISTTEVDGVTATSAELNKLDGVTANTAELNKLAGVTASTAEINKLAGVTASTTEINKLTGLTASTTELNNVAGINSSVQTQIDTKAPTANPTFTGTVTIGGATYPTSDGSAGQVLTTNGSGAVSFADPAGGGSADFVASGAISNGNVVSLNSDGTVSVISQTNVTQSLGSTTNYTSNSPSKVRSAYDASNNRVVIIYKDTSNSDKGTAVVGTISDTSISFGTPVIFYNSAISDYNDITYDKDNQKVIIYYSVSGGNTQQAVVGTVSNTSISFGSAQQVTSTGYHNAVVYDEGAQKVIFFWRYSSDPTILYGMPATVSGTSFSFDGPVTLTSTNVQDIRAIYNANAQKTVISYYNLSNSNYGEACVVSVSGSTLSYGTPVVFKAGNLNKVEPVSVTGTSKIIISYRDSDNSNYATAIVGEISGTSLSFGTASVYLSSFILDTGIAWDSTTSKVVFAVQNAGSSSVGQYIIGTLSGTTITVGSATTFNSSTTTNLNCVYNSNDSRVLISWLDNTNSVGESAVLRNSATLTNASSYIGVAAEAISNTATGSITINGGINEGQSSLAIGTTYYVSDTGVLQTTNNGRKIGKAISATKLLVNSNMSGDEINAYLGGLV